MRDSALILAGFATLVQSGWELQPPHSPRRPAGFHRRNQVRFVNMKLPASLSSDPYRHRIGQRYLLHPNLRIRIHVPIWGSVPTIAVDEIVTASITLKSCFSMRVRCSICRSPVLWSPPVQNAAGTGISAASTASAPVVRRTVATSVRIPVPVLAPDCDGFHHFAGTSAPRSCAYSAGHPTRRDRQKIVDHLFFKETPGVLRCLRALRATLRWMTGVDCNESEAFAERDTRGVNGNGRPQR
jgi:hypothetical protein